MYNNPAHTQPVNLLHHHALGLRTVHAYVSQPSAALGGRITTVPIGKCFGGSGSVNCVSRVSFHLCTKLPSPDTYILPMTYFYFVFAQL